MGSLALVSSREQYSCRYIKSKSELDSLFKEFNNPTDFVSYEVLKVQNLECDKLFPCYVIYVERFIYS